MEKRYMFSLTQENVETFRTLTRSMGMPPSTLSKAIDDFIWDINKTLLQAKERGTFTIRDVFNLMGEQMELLQKEEVRPNEISPIPERTPRIVKKRKEKKP